MKRMSGIAHTCVNEVKATIESPSWPDRLLISLYISKSQAIEWNGLAPATIGRHARWLTVLTHGNFPQSSLRKILIRLHKRVGVAEKLQGSHGVGQSLEAATL